MQQVHTGDNTSTVTWDSRMRGQRVRRVGSSLCAVGDEGSIVAATASSMLLVRLCFAPKSTVDLQSARSTDSRPGVHKSE